MGVPLENNWEFFDDQVWMLAPHESGDWYFWMPQLTYPQAGFLVAFPDYFAAGTVQYGPFSTEVRFGDGAIQTRYHVTVTNPTDDPLQFQLILMTFGVPYGNL